MTTIRQQRVSELLFQELSILVGGELDDPRLEMVDVVQVNVSRDLRSARVYVYQQGEDAAPRDILRGLERATPYLRSQLAERCGLRLVPDIFFTYDDTPQQAARVEELLQQIAQERIETESTTAAESSNATTAVAATSMSESATISPDTAVSSETTLAPDKALSGDKAPSGIEEIL